MSEVKDPAIKLFGKTIQLLHLDHVVLAKPDEQQQSSSGDIKKRVEKEHATSQTEDTCSNQSTSSGMNDGPRTPTPDKETCSTKKENPNSEEKPQKPDKILPCPRCNSMDTKFCYYNNYNVNQPRHFCKHCQRYWTDGGAMRNTPVGSGRRKIKTSSSASASASYYRHLIISEALNPSSKTNGSVLNFGSDVPLCESMNSALNFSDKPQKSGDDHSSCASISVGSNGFDKSQKYPLQIACFPAPYPWNPAHYRPPMNLGHPGIPVNFFPTPQYLGCSVQVQPNPWSMPLVIPNSPLGKHSRDGHLLSPSSSSGSKEFSKDKDSESGIMIPKTLRIIDPNEAAKSSFWSTLGISKDEHGNNSTNGGNLNKIFQSVSDEKNEVDATSLVNLQANPAALSRSLNFRETS